MRKKKKKDSTLVFVTVLKLIASNELKRTTDNYIRLLDGFNYLQCFLLDIHASTVLKYGMEYLFTYFFFLITIFYSIVVFST